MEYIMAYDFGTSGVKAALVTFQGELLCTEERGYSLITGPNGFAEQNPEEYWSAVCAATKAVVASAKIDSAMVTGMAFSTQGLGIIPIDADGNVLYNNISWIDTRARKQADEINALLGEELFAPADVPPKYLWIKQNLPEVYEKTKYFLDCTAFLNFKATGKCYLDYSAKAPYHTHPKIAATRKRQYDLIGIDTEKFPPLLPCAGYVGNLTERAAGELGLTTNAEVYMGVVDVTCAAIGAGCCREGDAHIYLGTSGWLTALIGYERLESTSTGIWQLLSWDPTKQIYGGCVQSAGMALNWMIDQFYHIENELSKDKRLSYLIEDDIFKIINADVSTVPAGSEGLLATPWFMGEGCPISDEKAKATFIGASPQHTRRHFVRAMMESLCYSLRMEYEYYQHDTGKTLQKIGAIGGGALSDPWMQMMADVMNLPVYRPRNCRHSGAIGSAAIAMVGKGVYKMEEIDQFIQIEQTFEPIPEHVEVYNKSYEIWKKIYPALKDIYADIY